MYPVIMPETTDDLISIGSVRLILGCNRSRADQISRSKGFPEPAQERTMGKVTIRWWTRSAVEAYAAARKITTSTEAEQP